MKIKDYFVPKSLIYTGKHNDTNTIIKNHHYEQDLIVTKDFKKQTGKNYIQVIGLSDVETIESIKSIYPIDGLILEDIFNVHQRVKIEDRQTHQFSSLHVMYEKEGITHLDYFSMVMFEDTLISFHEKEPVFLEPLVTLLNSYDELKKRNIDFLYYQILDIITDKHLDILEKTELDLEVFESDILETQKVDQESFYKIRKQLLKLKNITSPILNELDKALENKHLFRAQNHHYFGDLKDHLNRLADSLNEQRESIRQLLDLHINNQSNQMNQVMKTLTLFSAIFIPLSFLTGFFGMNFEHFGILKYEHAVIAFLILCLIIMLAMLYFFKRLKYFK